MTRRTWRRGGTAAVLGIALLAAPIAAQEDPEAHGRAPAATSPTDSLSLSLEDAVARARTQSEEVKLARSQVELADAQVRNVRAGALPQISGTFGFTRTFESQFQGGGTFTLPDSLKFQPDSLASVEQRLRYLEKHTATAGLGGIGSLFTSLPFGQENAYALNVNGSQLLYSGGRVGAAMKTASLFQQAAGLQLVEQTADIDLGVRTAYYHALLAGELNRISEAAVQQADEFLSQERLRQRSGSSSELDVMRAEVSASNLRTQAIQATNAWEIAELDLRRLVNLPVDQPLRLTTKLEIPSPERLSQEPSDSAALANRAAVEAAERQVSMSELGVKIAKAAYLPSVSARFAFGRSLFPNTVFGFSGTDWRKDLSASLSVDIPIFDGLRRNAAVDQATVQSEQARLQLAQLKEAVRIQYEAATGERRRAAEAILARQQTVAQAQKVYDLTVLRYDRGLATQLEVSDARLALLQAGTNLAQALSDFYIAEATVQRSLGRSVGS